MMLKKPYRFDPIRTTLVGLWLIPGVIVVRTVFFSPAESPPGEARTTVNVNKADWWELSVLPKIGETTAKQIVRYRSDVMNGGKDQPFHTAGDVTRVRGIGPKTVQRIAPYLRFDD